MGDQLLALTDIEEVLSEVYVSAIAARAGYSFAKPNLDRDSVDLIISAGGQQRPQINLQLKASFNLKIADEHIPFPLKIKNYNDLRVETLVPRILVVMRLPKDIHQWLSDEPDELIIRHCAYWMSLRGEPEVGVKETKTVYIPVQNRFDVAGLKSLMEQSRTGVIK